MPFCSNCGAKIPQDVNFCPICGHKIKEPKPAVVSPPEESLPVSGHKYQTNRVDKTFTLLENGQIFNDTYRIEKVIERDNDGISYLVIDESCGARRALKLYYQYYFDNVSKLLGSIVNLTKIKTISSPHVAKVYEVNQIFQPAYIVSEYVEGKPLARLKERGPELLNEEKSRIIAKQIMEAAIAIRKVGMSVYNINLNNIVLTVNHGIIVLSSSIGYEFKEEREDIFAIGILLAKLFSTSAFYETLYTNKKVLARKFEFISGITKGMNEIIAKCLIRNPSLRYATFGDLSRALSALKPVSKEDIYEAGEDDITTFKDDNELKIPKRHLDIYFWIVIILIIGFIFTMMSTNLLDTIFGQKQKAFKFTGFLVVPEDSTSEESVPVTDNSPKAKANEDNVWRQFNPANINPKQPARTVNPNINIPPAQPVFNEHFNTPETNITRKQPPAPKRPNLPTTPEGLVYLYADTYAYGSLKKDAKHNVSLNRFYISKSEVTQAEWNRVMKPAKVSLRGDNLPVDNVSWYDAILYCNARSSDEGLTPCYMLLGKAVVKKVTCNWQANGYRLPTEAEWEYAARANNLTQYSGSNSPDQVAWYLDNAQAHLHMIKTKADNAFGIFDMTGNVAEWCWDWYDSNYPKTMPYLNPSGPDNGSARVIRGGNISTGEGANLEVIYRSKAAPTQGYRYIGFRVVKSK